MQAYLIADAYLTYQQISLLCVECSNCQKVPAQFAWRPNYSADFRVYRK
jgi:hypothetical protein